MYVARHVAVGIQLFTATAARIARTCAAGPPHAGKKRIKRGMFRPVAIPPPARAGKTDIAARDTQIEEDHPRVCGENDSIMF